MGTWKLAARIVLDGSSREDRVLRQAAEELQEHVKLLTGIELPIEYALTYGRKMPTGLNNICLGKSLLPGVKAPWFIDGVWRERLAATDGDCGRDGFAIRLDPENPACLHVFGSTSKGTMNGVFRLLENNTDLIWVRPNLAFGTVFTPTPGKLDFVWGKDFVTVPDTRARG